MSDQAMTLPDALDVIHRQRRDAVVITTMGSARDWQQFEPHPKDLVYMPSSMGQGPPLGLGIALAQPDQRVIVVNGDGCMLMNLGCLVTITAHAPKNFTLIIIDNGVYEVTGNQATIGAAAKEAQLPPRAWSAEPLLPALVPRQAMTWAADIQPPAARPAPCAPSTDEQPLPSPTEDLNAVGIVMFFHLVDES